MVVFDPTWLILTTPNRMAAMAFFDSFSVHTRFSAWTGVSSNLPEARRRRLYDKKQILNCTASLRHPSGWRAFKEFGLEMVRLLIADRGGMVSFSGRCQEDGHATG